jgi:hypothetical protein
MTRTAAMIQAINACGPFMAAMNRGIVTKGPIPTMLEIFSAID